MAVHSTPVETAVVDTLAVREISVVIPEFLVGLRSLGSALHGQSALALKIALLDRPNTVVISVPFHIGQLRGPNANGSQRVAVPLSTRMQIEDFPAAYFMSGID